MEASVQRRRSCRRIPHVIVLALVAGTLGLVSPSAAQHVALAEPVAALAYEPESGEIVSMRTRTSRTYARPNGEYRAVISPGSLNYPGANGAWQPIDNRLVPSMSPGYAHENRANRYRLSLPFDLALAPVRVEAEGAWISFSLAGASGVAGVSGATATYADALSGVTVAYEALPDRVKETLTLAGPNATRGPFRFAVRTSAGLAAARNGEGGIDFSNRAGTVLFSFAPPDVADSSGMVPTREPVSLALASRSGGFLVTLAVDPAWLADPARSWPVVIDPLLEVTPNLDCQIAAGQPTTNFCSANTLRVGKDGAARRSLLKFDLSSIPAKHVTVTNAELSLYCTAKTTSNAADYVVHRVTRSWTNGATWNRYDGTNNWTSPGGDFHTSEYATLNTNCATLGEKNWYPTDLVQEWADGTHANHGLLLKQKTEGVTNVLDFGSVEHTDPAKRPHLEVQYSRWQGLLPYWTYETQQISDRTALHVNVASGNAVVHQRDLMIAGTGLDLSVDRYYNSHFVGGANIFGRNWTLGNADDVELNTHSNGDVRWKGPSNYEVLFKKNPNGNFTTPPGINATLVKNGNGTHTLTFRDKGRFEFGSSDLNSHVDKNGNQISFARNGNGNPSEITDTRGRKVSFTYNANGFVTSVTDVAAARTHTYGYDTNALPRLTSITDPEGKTTTFGYDPTKYLTSITDPRGNQTKITYTSGLVTKIVRVTNPANGTGPTTNFAYSAASAPCDPAVHAFKTVVTDPRSNQTTYCADRQGRVRKVIDPLGRNTTATFSANSDLTSGTNAAGGISDSTYSTDGNNNLLEAQGPVNSGGQRATSSYRYDDAANPHHSTAYTNAQGKRWNHAYDGNGNLCAKSEGLPSGTLVCASGPGGGNNPVRFEYHTNGTLKKATDAKGAITNYTYNALGELISIDHPAPLGDVTLTYDAVSRLSTITDGKAQTTTYSYDKLDRTTRIDYQGGSIISFAYDNNGNLTSRTGSTGTTTYSYDKLNRLEQETKPGPVTVSYGYDGVSNLTSLSNGWGTTTYAYDAANRLSSIQEPSSPGGRAFIYAYPSETQSTITLPNLAKMELTHDTGGRLLSIVSKNAGGSTVASYAYTYSYQDGAQTKDGTVRRTVTDEAGNATTYSYDGVGRLERAQTSGPNPSDYQYCYDPNGNLISRSIGCSPVDYTHNAANQLTNTGFSYDANGNLTASPTLSSLAYNPKEHTTSITPSGGGSVAMTYAGPDQVERTQAGNDAFVSDQLGIGSRTSGGTTTFYTRDPSGLVLAQRVGTNQHYFLVDALNSVIGLTDSSGGLVSNFVYRYEPYGKLENTLPQAYPDNPWRFANYQFDTNTGLYKVGLRYYDPVIERWTQRDPIDQPLDERGWNRYIYVGDDPINFTDPSGAFLKRIVSKLANCSLKGWLTMGSGAAVAAAGAIAGGLIIAGGVAEVGAASAATGGVAGPLAVLTTHLRDG